jgi:hypothetical protein
MAGRSIRLTEFTAANKLNGRDEKVAAETVKRAERGVKSPENLLKFEGKAVNSPCFG